MAPRFTLRRLMRVARDLERECGHDALDAVLVIEVDGDPRPIVGADWHWTRDKDGTFEGAGIALVMGEDRPVRDTP